MASAARERTLTEWVVLGLLAEAPAHGFALTRLLAPGGEIGQVWAASRPLTYRAIDQLAQDHLIVTAGTESGHGPTRVLYELTADGRAALRDWLRTPVSRFRDVRAELLVKLVLLERAGRPSTSLLTAQRRAFAPLLAQVRARPAADPVSRWRTAQAEAIAGFLELG